MSLSAIGYREGASEAAGNSWYIIKYNKLVKICKRIEYLLSLNPTKEKGLDVHLPAVGPTAIRHTQRALQREPLL